MTELRTVPVLQLQEEGLLFVEDGNHGADRPRPNEFVSTGVAFIRAGDLKNGRIDFDGASRINDVAYQRIRKGFGRPFDVLLSHKGTVGRVALAPENSPPFVCSPQTTYWRSLNHDEVDPRYLRYFLESPMFVQQLDARSGETDMAAYVSLTEQRKLLVALPSPDAQRAIANTLGGIDSKIDSNHRSAEIAEELLDLLTAAGDLPLVPLGDLVEVDRTQCEPAAAGEHLVEHFSIPAFDQCRLPDLTPGDTIKSNKFEVGRESVLVSRLNPGTNRTWFAVPTAGLLAAASTEFLVLRPRPPISLGALWLAVRAESFRDELVRRATGTSGSHQRVRPDDALAIAVPDTRLLEDGVAAEAEALLRRAHHARVESATLGELRDMLLPELLSGRIRVRPEFETVGSASS